MERSHAIALGAVGLAGAAIALGVLLLRDPSSAAPRTPAGPGGSGGPGGSTPLPGVSPLTPSRPGTPGPRTARSPNASGPLAPAALAIAGFVRDPRGRPVPGARVAPVTDAAHFAIAGADGAFRLEVTPNADHELHALALLAQGPAPLAARVVPAIVPGTTDLVIVLRAGDGTLLGRVVRADASRAPVAGARIEATVGDWLGRATSDADGRFRLEGAPAGALGLVVSAEGLIPRIVTVPSVRGASPEHEIALDPGVRLSGKVVRGGAPVAGATVSMRETGVPLPFERRTTTSDASGKFTFDALPACEASLFARTTDGVSTIHVVRTDGARTPEPVTLELGPGSAVLGRVVAAGQPVAGAALALEDPLEGSAERVATTGEDGRFRIEPVLSGDQARELSVRVRATGFASKRVALVPGTEQEIELATAGAVRLTIAAAEARAEARDATGELHLFRAAGSTSGKLELVSDDLAPGTAWVVARVPGKAPVSRQVEVAAGATAQVDLVAVAGSTIDGRCMGDDGLPLGGASVVATDPASGPLGASAAAVADEDGRFTIQGVPPGKVHLVASVAGYIDAQLDVDAGASGLALELARAYALEVDLASPGPSIVRAFVTLTPLEGKGEKLERAVAGEGTSAVALFEPLHGQRYRVEAFVPGLAPARQDVDPRSGTSVSLTLGAGAKAAGVVLAPDGTPLPGAAIVRGTDPNEDLESEGTFATLLAMTEAEGTFEVFIAPEGESVVITHPRYAPLLAQLKPGEGQKLQLSEGARITGRTLGKDGAPRADVGVSLEGPVAKRGSSGPDGTFVFTGLLPGRYRVRRHDAAPDAPGGDVTVGERGEVSVDLKAP